MELNILGVVAIVLGLTQWIKTKLKLVDTAAEVLSFIVGFVLGGAYQYVYSQPVDAASWFAVVLTALGMALVPSGLYKFVGMAADRFAAINTVNKSE